MLPAKSRGRTTQNCACSVSSGSASRVVRIVHGDARHIGVQRDALDQAHDPRPGA